MSLTISDLTDQQKRYLPQISTRQPSYASYLLQLCIIFIIVLFIFFFKFYHFTVQVHTYGCTCITQNEPHDHNLRFLVVVVVVVTGIMQIHTKLACLKLHFGQLFIYRCTEKSGFGVLVEHFSRIFVKYFNNNKLLILLKHK